MSESQQLAELYRTFGPVVYRRCMKLLGDRERAQDATQEVFMKLLKHSERFSDAAAAIPWAMTVATHHCLHQMRDTKRQGAHLEQLGKAVTEAAPSLEHAQADRELATAALGRADPLTRKIVVGVVVEEREQQQVARELGVSSKTVTRKLQRFFDAARKYLARSGP